MIKDFYGSDGGRKRRESLLIDVYLINVSYVMELLASNDAVHESVCV